MKAVKTSHGVHIFPDNCVPEEYQGQAVDFAPETRPSGGHYDMDIQNGEVLWVRRRPSPEEELEELRRENRLLKAQIQAQLERSDFMDDVIAEMAANIYGGTEE